jgi:hypothetical protein
MIASFFAISRRSMVDERLDSESSRSYASLVSLRLRTLKASVICWNRASASPRFSLGNRSG